MSGPGSSKTILRITTRYDNVYAYDVVIKNQSGSNGPIISKEGKTELVEGFAVDIFDELCRILNYSYTLVTTVGHRDFEQASNEKIDLFVYSSSLLLERAKLVDFSFVTQKSKVVGILNHDFELQWQNILTTPFSINLWFGLIFIALLLVFSASIFSLFEKRNFTDGFIQCLGLILQKDAGLKFQSKFTNLTIWLAATCFLVVTALYAGNIISIRTVARYGINSLETLAESDYSILIEYGCETLNISTIFQIAKAMEANGYTTMGKILEKSCESNYNFIDFDQVIRDVNQYPIAYVIDEETAFSSISETIGYYPCTWSEISFGNIQYAWTFYMRKGSPYKSNINSGLLLLDERGLLERLRKKWLPRIRECSNGGSSSSDTKNAININQISLAYLIIGVGIIGSIIALGLELIYFQNNKNNKK